MYDLYQKVFYPYINQDSSWVSGLVKFSKGGIIEDMCVLCHFCVVGKGSLGPKAAALNLHEVKDHQVRKPHL